MFDFTDQSGKTNYAPYLTLFGGTLGAASRMVAASQSAALMRANARVAGMQAQSALESGKEQADIYRQKLGQTLGAQHAAIGGANITTSGSALKSLEATSQIGAEDIARIQLDAARKAWGFNIDQQGDLLRAKEQQSAGVMSGIGDLITTGAKAYGQWHTED